MSRSRFRSLFIVIVAALTVGAGVATAGTVRDADAEPTAASPAQASPVAPFPAARSSAPRRAAAANALVGPLDLQVASRRLAPQTPRGTVLVTFRLRRPLSDGRGGTLPGVVRISGLGPGGIDHADFSRPSAGCYEAGGFARLTHGGPGRRLRVTLSGVPGLAPLRRTVPVRRMTPFGATKRLGCFSSHL